MSDRELVILRYLLAYRIVRPPKSDYGWSGGVSAEAIAESIGGMSKGSAAASLGRLKAVGFVDRMNRYAYSPTEWSITHAGVFAALHLHNDVLRSAAA